MPVAVRPLERSNGLSFIYVGAEPSAIFRSADNGATWRDLAALRQLLLALTWSFPHESGLLILGQGSIWTKCTGEFE
jgi:hypothetical protein